MAEKWCRMETRDDKEITEKYIRQHYSSSEDWEWIEYLLKIIDELRETIDIYTEDWGDKD